MQPRKEKKKDLGIKVNNGWCSPDGVCGSDDEAFGQELDTQS
jgi:hypothetical protein